MTQLKKQFAGTFFSNAGITLLNFLTGVITARALNPAGRGETAAIMIWSQTLGWLFALGLAEASTYHMSTDPKSGKRLVGTALLGIIVLGMCGSLVAEFILPIVLRAADPQTLSIGRWYMLSIVVVIGVETLKGILSGDHDFSFMNGVRIAQPLIYALAILAMFMVHKASVTLVLVCAAGSSLILIIASLIRIFNRIGIGKPSMKIFKSALAYGIRVHPGNMSDIANRRVDQLFMTGLVSSTDFGFYSVAVNISLMTVLLLGNLCVVVFPAAARIGGKEGLDVVSRSIRIVAILGFILTIGLMLIGPLLIRLIYGTAYLGSIIPLEILLPGGAFLAVATIAASGLQSANRPLMASLAQISGAIVTVIGLSIRIYFHHLTIESAAITATFAYAVTCVLALLMLSKCPGFSISDTLSKQAVNGEAKKLWHWGSLKLGLRKESATC